MSKLLSKLEEHNRLFRSYVENKTIAIVGPASSAMLQESGDIIEKCDIVVRINRGFENLSTKQSFLGKRTDILYNSLDMDKLCGGDLFSSDLNKVKFICCPYSIKERTFSNRIFSPITKNNNSLFDSYNIRFIEDEIYFNVKSETNSRVNSGFGAIVDILEHNVNNVFITGIDFYRSVYQVDYNKDRNWGSDYKKIEEDLEFKIFNDSNHHNPDRQYSYFKKMYFKNKNKITLDNFMKKIINDERYDKWDTIPR